MKKGFTLIELLAVIAVLATIVLVSVPKITNVIENTKQKNYENQVVLIKGAVEKYLSSDTDLIPKNTGDSIDVTLQTLVDNGIYKTIPIDPRSGEALPSNSCVTVTRSENGLVYEYPDPESAGGIWTFEVTIPAGGATFSFGVANADLTINWDDGAQTNHSYVGDDYISHDYAEGVYEVTIEGTTNHITFCNFLNEACVATNQYLTGILTTVPVELGLTDASYMFRQTTALNSIVPNFFDAASANITKMTGMFIDMEQFDEDINGWDTSKVTDMSNMFAMYIMGGSFNKDISSWDTSNVVNMGGMFFRSYYFNRDISSWNVSKVTDMSYMFYGAMTFNQNISSWDTSKVTDMSYMFSVTNAFNQDLSLLNISSVTNMKHMFSSTRFFNQDISGWDMSKVEDISYMFYDAESFNQPIGAWNTSSVTNMKAIFRRTDAFNQDLSGWDTSKVTDMAEMFRDAALFNQDLSSWCVTNISSKPSYFDYNATNWVLSRPIWGTCP